MRQSATRRENTFRQVKGNLRFPLTATYHGCHSSTHRLLRDSGASDFAFRLP
jgi:hypothetical protein